VRLAAIGRKAASAKAKHRQADYSAERQSLHKLEASLQESDRKALAGFQADAEQIKTHQLDAVIQTGAEFGMQSMDKTLVSLIHAGTISYDEARNFAIDIDELDRLMRD